MGSAYPTIAADVLARFHRLSGRPVRFVTGTDEHGEKIALAAAKRGMQPQEHCDDIVASYKHLWKLVRALLACKLCIPEMVHNRNCDDDNNMQDVVLSCSVE